MKETANKCLSLALALVFLLALLPGMASAADVVASGECGAQGNNLTWTLDGDGVLTISGSGAMADYDYDSDNQPWSGMRGIVKSLQIDPGVTSIGYCAFKDCTNITSISLPNTLQIIGWCAFWGCYGLTEVTIPASVTQIEDDAFAWCTNVSRYDVEEGNPAYASSAGCLETADHRVFLAYPAGSSNGGIKLAYSLTEIKSFAFTYAANLKNLWLTPGITYLPYCGFYGSGLEKIYIPSSVTEIWNYALDGCSSLTDVYYGGSREQWQAITVHENNDSLLNAAIHCTDDANEIPDSALTWSLDGSGTLTISGTGAIPDYDLSFYGEPPWYWLRDSIKRVVLGAGVASVGKSAFNGCSKLESVVFPEGLQSIGQWAYENCSALTEIQIPKSVTNISDGAFQGCDGLTSVTVKAGNTVYHSNGNNLIETAERKLILGSPDGFIPSDGSVTSIGRWAYNQCSQLTTISIPNTVTSIGYAVFYCCDNLKSAVIPDSVKSIDEYAFEGCTALTSVTISSGISGISKSTFYNCSSLTSISIPSSVTSIGEYAFYGCSGLTSISIPDSVSIVGKAAFLGCSSLKSISIPDNVTSIGEAAFYSCSGLKTVLIPSSVTSIGTYAFDRCSSLTSVIISSNVTSIGEYTFYGCSSLKSVAIPSKVTSIGLGAFSNCSILNDVYFEGTESQWRAIEIEDGNNPLLEATLHYDYSMTPLSIQFTSKTINIGESVQFTAMGGAGGYIWRIGNTATATVTSSGKVTGVAVGNTYLYCQDSFGTEVKCLLKVVDEPLSIRYAAKTITIGTPFQFTATGGAGGYTWRTGNSSVATVNSTGKVTGKSVGNTYLYCKDSAGTEVRCYLEVRDPLSIRYSAKTITIGTPFQFSATGGVGGYTWRTGNSSVATVDSTGKVTGKTVGNTYLYCKDSAGTEVRCYLEVREPLSIRYADKTITIGTPFQFSATGGSGGYTWRTGNSSVATVDSTGKVTGKTSGSTYLYCKDSAGSEAKCLLKVIAPLSIRYSEKIVTVGIPFQFSAIGGSGAYTWRTGNTDTAAVDASGKVTGKAAGNTYLYCRDSYGNEVRCLLKVIAPLSIRYSEKTVAVGSTFQFSATGGSGTYTWRTGNSSVATVDSTGKVTGKTVGNTYLYCRDSYGNEVKCLLKIKA